MQYLYQAIDFFLHLDRYLQGIISEYGVLTYAILFLIIFCETGLVVTPFLPGDSLLFAVGAFTVGQAGHEAPLNLFLIMGLLSVAAILGDSVNYWAGHFIGEKVFDGRFRFLKREYLERTHRFYEKYGKQTIIIARFVPIVRTIAPFVAGVGAMTYSRFMIYNITGGLLWIFSFLLLGHFFANLPIVKKNFSLVILGIIILSVMPAVIEIIRARRKPE